MELVKLGRLLVLLALASAASLVATATAMGGGCGTPSGGGSAAVAQYTEQIPTSCGSKPSGSSGKSAKLPHSIEKKIDQQADSKEQAETLKEVATSPKFGAPTTTKIQAPHKVNKKPKGKHKTAKRTATKPTLKAKPKQNPLVASVSVATDGSNGRLIALLVMMAGVLALVLAAALYRRRSTR